MDQCVVQPRQRECFFYPDTLIGLLQRAAFNVWIVLEKKNIIDY